MDYDLDSLGTRNFEHLTQSLLSDLIGPKLMVFGDGPDGGREATWHGEAPSFGAQTNWDGYGVLQAKFRQQKGDPKSNLTWIKASIRAELMEWTRPGSKRREKPNYILFATNVRLSSAPDSGKDEVHSYVRDLLNEFKIDVAGYRVLDYYEIRDQLDNNKSVRERYAAFITSGDVIVRLVQEMDGIQEAFGQALATYTAKCLRDDSSVNLTQAGTAGDGQVTIADIFIDLPADLPIQDWLDQDPETPEEEVESRPEESLYLNEFESYELQVRSGIANHLINAFNHIPDTAGEEQSSRDHRTVLIGGPGQGKSTVTQWLAQMYRAEFLKDSRLLATSNVAETVERTDARRVELNLPAIQARRWPVRIVLTELADYLAKNGGRSLLHYIASKVTEGSSFEIDSMMLRKWLSAYPWLVLIDGLDEVPSSSNRQQVMTAINDFFMEAAAVGGDVAAVATTRPQGYGEEFSPKEYRHFQLNPLEVDEALAFARGLVSARMGEGTAPEAKVMNRLTLASKEEHTRKLFESPLQVTILEVLLEKLHKAPSDRSRLYSAYFNVISQREQEKSGPLSDLLQKFESDVNYLHRRIGFELQKRGAGVGETSSSLSTKEFDEFIIERFRDQGHPEESVEGLSKAFSALVTDRLVFLAKLESNRIGFELRSLQEFMAAEHIVHFPESKIIDAIQSIAKSAYWRNVVLFAIGSIFAGNEHLRAEVVLLCEQLNDEPTSSGVLLPGADLAIDVLRDGSCLSMPKYAQRLTRNAIRVLEQPIANTAKILLFILDTDYSEILWSSAESDSLASGAHMAGRAALLSALRAHDAPRADAALGRLLGSISQQEKTVLIEWTWHSWDQELARLLAGEFTACRPAVFFRARGGVPHISHIRRRESSGDAPDWITHLAAVNDPFRFSTFGA